VYEKSLATAGVVRNKHRLVQMRTRIVNQRQALAMNARAIAGRKNCSANKGERS
jgi:hypothetical protein